jgi:hypothetical protein
MSQSLILIDSFFCLLGEERGRLREERERERERERGRMARGFFPKVGGRTHLAGCAGQDFHGW